MSPLPPAFSRRLVPGRPAVLHHGLGDAWWWGRHPIVSDGARLWWGLGTQVVPLPWPNVHHVVERRGTLHAWSTPLNQHLVASRVGWQARGRFTSVPGPGVYRRHAGYLYRRRQGRWRPVDVDRPRWLAGPHGALVAGSDGWAEYGAAPGRTPRPLPEPLWWPSLRFSSSGRHVAGVTAGEEMVRIDLRAGAVVAPRPGLPMGAFGRQARREYSAAGWGPWAAGPDGVVWDLRSGRRAFRSPTLALGVTVGTPTGFVTVDWASHEAWHVSFHGVVAWRITLPLDPDDTVIAGAWVDGAVHLCTALGEGLVLANGSITEGGSTPAESVPVALDLGPAGSMPVALQAMVGGHRFGWTEDGWLIAVPVD